MRNSILSVTSNACCIGTIVLSVQDIEEIISIISLCIGIAVMIINVSLRFYDRIKDGKLTPDEIKETIDDVKDIHDTINKEADK